MAAANTFRPIYPLAIFGTTLPGYIAIYSVLLNFGIAIVLTLLFNITASKRTDETAPGDFVFETGPAMGGH